ncbi:MAG: EAL domain-containing protein [Burkholderiales bacterium]
MQDAVRERAEMDAGLRLALLESQFVLHYQVQVDQAGHAIGVEALVRWNDPRRGMIYPGEFIPLAEETGLILPLGAWVLQTACEQLARWANDPVMSTLTLAVNVSARQFRQPDFVDQVVQWLDRSGARADRLKLELTESVLVSDADVVIASMNALKGRGVSFALDDFGTGYSSLSYLKRLPLDQLKIDQGFVRDILIDPNDAAIARTVIALGNSMGLAVIAEGVETQAQRATLAAMGCQYFQGYLFGRPVPVEALVAELHQP